MPDHTTEVFVDGEKIGEASKFEFHVHRNIDTCSYGLGCRRRAVPGNSTTEVRVELGAEIPAKASYESIEVHSDLVYEIEDVQKIEYGNGKTVIVATSIDMYPLDEQTEDETLFPSSDGYDTTVGE